MGQEIRSNLVVHFFVVDELEDDVGRALGGLEAHAILRHRALSAFHRGVERHVSSL